MSQRMLIPVLAVSTIIQAKGDSLADFAAGKER